MNKTKIFCTSVKYFSIIDKLPNYIIPLGLGEEKFPSNWMDEKSGKNISYLNSNYGELTGIYWIWKNVIKDMSDDDNIGNCHYRKLWLDKLYMTKQKTSFDSLFKHLLKTEDINRQNFDVIQVQPIEFKSKNLLDDFLDIHKTDLLKKSLNFLDNDIRDSFLIHLNQSKLYPLNMFITKVKYFREYCEVLFPWLDKCFKYCEDKNLCTKYNIRLPAFLAERFTSFWFSQKVKKVHFSYARLGSFFLSNNINKTLNPIKIPLTFRMYPTLHKY